TPAEAERSCRTRGQQPRGRVVPWPDFRGWPWASGWRLRLRSLGRPVRSVRWALISAGGGGSGAGGGGGGGGGAGGWRGWGWPGAWWGWARPSWAGAWSVGW